MIEGGQYVTLTEGRTLSCYEKDTNIAGEESMKKHMWWTGGRARLSILTGWISWNTLIRCFTHALALRNLHDVSEGVPVVIVIQKRYQ